MKTVYGKQVEYYGILKDVGFRRYGLESCLLGILSTRFSFALHDFDVLRMNNELDREISIAESKLEALKEIKRDLARIK